MCCPIRSATSPICFRSTAASCRMFSRGRAFDIERYLARVEPGHGGLALGLRAIRDGHGFRNDGSEQYGDFLVAHFLYPQNERQHAPRQLRDGKEMYVYGDTVSAAALAATGGLADLVQGARHHRDRLPALVHADALQADDRGRQAHVRPEARRRASRRCSPTTATIISTSPTARRSARPTTISSTAGTPPSGSICGCTRKWSRRCPTCWAHIPIPLSSRPPTRARPIRSMCSATARSKVLS